MMPLPVVLRPLAEHSWLNRAALYIECLWTSLLVLRCTDLHRLMLACNFTTLQTPATLTRTPPDFLLAHTVASWTSQERLQWLTIWQTEPSWMLPHYEFRFQLTTNYCESCLLEDANTTGFEFFRLHWLPAPQTICPSHLTFLRETFRCCNRHLQPRHWRSKRNSFLPARGPKNHWRRNRGNIETAPNRSVDV